MLLVVMSLCCSLCTCTYVGVLLTLYMYICRCVAHILHVHMSVCCSHCTCTYVGVLLTLYMYTGLLCLFLYLCFSILYHFFSAII